LPAERLTSGKYNRQSALPLLLWRVTHVDLYVLAQTREAIHELAFRDAARLAAQHAGRFGLWNAEQRCSFDLSQPLFFQDFADFADELSFDEQAAGRSASEIGVDAAAADFVIMRNSGG
jgi:hypothetical protein